MNVPKQYALLSDFISKLLTGMRLRGVEYRRIQVGPAALPPRALSIIFSGIAVGTVVAVPLGSYLGRPYGWRSAFLAAAVMGRSR